MRKWLFICLGSFSLTHAQEFKPQSPAEAKWVDSVYTQLSQEERIGQLFMIAAYSNKSEAHAASIDSLVSKYNVGGLIFFQGGPGRQAHLTNRFQRQAKVPLLIGIDAEWGLAMRLDSVPRFPWNMSLGAIRDTALIRQVGKAYADQANRLGVHFNFAPAVDVNTNPKNPIIGNRSFGENPQRVTNHARALIRGIQNNGVFATGKHFPGHGDTSKDSHYTLPSVNKTREELEAGELYPYRELFKEGLSSVMVAHLSVPALEPRTNFPSSLSKAVVTDLLQGEMGFEGLIFTDALNMKGAANFAAPGRLDLEAFLAGNDVLLFAENVPVAMDIFCGAMQDSIVTEQRLAYSVKKILAYKYRVNLHQFKPIDTTNLVEDLNPIAHTALQYRLYNEMLTVLTNQNEVLPLRDLANENLAYVHVGEPGDRTFLQQLRQFVKVTEVDMSLPDSLRMPLDEFTKVIVGLHKSEGAWRNQELKTQEIELINQLARTKPTILTGFIKPYALDTLGNMSQFESVVVAYQNNALAHRAAADLLFGGIPARGILPVSIGTSFAEGHGLRTRELPVLGYDIAENVGMNSKALAKIDAMAQKAIQEGLTPGVQIVVARHGKVVYQKAFGHHTFEQDAPIDNATIYDLASLTKIMGMLPHIIQAVDRNEITVNDRLGELIPGLNKSDKAKLRLRDVLAHTAKLPAWIPFYKSTLDAAGKPSEQWYRRSNIGAFNVPITENLYLHQSFKDSIFYQIADAELLSKKQYKYSDLGFILLRRWAERHMHTSLDEAGAREFYRPLGMHRTGYLPLHRFDECEIAPTEVDNYFRHDTVHGYVHDMASAMEGGVSGHAGLFGTAIDVTKMMQLYLQKGVYGDKRYFSAETFDQFNTRYYSDEQNRRGLGFDKQQFVGQAGPTCGCVSDSSFGHTGFTGTIAWADPQTGVIYVFLSNRTYPTAEPNKLSRANVREKIQQVIQEALYN